MAFRSRRGLGGWRWWGGAVTMVGLLVSLTPRVGYTSVGQFPEPDGLASAVRFWIATFTEYGRRDVVIHDRLEPGRVYEVVRDVGADDDVRVQIGLEAAVDRVRRATRACGLSLFEAPATTLEPLLRIRTHRGMREAFAQGIVAERLFRAAVRRALAAEKLPLDLAAIPLVESTYHPGLVSQAGAVG